jgi:hypothetical protein
LVHCTAPDDEPPSSNSPSSLELDELLGAMGGRGPTPRGVLVVPVVLTLLPSGVPEIVLSGPTARGADIVVGGVPIRPDTPSVDSDGRNVPMPPLAGSAPLVLRVPVVLVLTVPPIAVGEVR